MSGGLRGGLRWPISLLQTLQFFCPRVFRSGTAISNTGRQRTHAVHNPMAMTTVMAASSITVAEAAGDPNTGDVMGWTILLQSTHDNLEFG